MPVEEAADKDTQAAVSGDDAAAAADSAAAAAGFQPVKAEPNAPKTEEELAEERELAALEQVKAERATTAEYCAEHCAPEQVRSFVQPHANG